MKLIKIVAVTMFVGIFLGILYKFYISHLAAFGCFDDCFNYGAGFFITKGKLLYRDIFFNHQPLPAYLTAVIQTITKPINIYELLLRHRQFIFLFSFVFDSILILRFGITGVIFTILYESTKWYLFGDRFLAEAMIVYPLVYISGVCFDLSKKIKIYRNEGLLVALFAWFVIFSREPYIPLALFLFTFAIWKSKQYRGVLLFLFLSLGTLTLLPLRDYFYNVILVTQQTVFANSLQQISFSQRVLQMIGYPLLIAFSLHPHIFWQFIQGIGILFLITVILSLWKKNIYLSVLLWSILVLANSRAVTIDTVFYQGFQLLPWYGLFIFLTVAAINNLRKTSRLVSYFLFIVLGFLCIRLFVSPQFWFKEKISPQQELITNYSSEIQVGNAVHELSKSNQTLFLDGWGELIFWQANRISPYKYSWYTSVMPLVSLYRQERTIMFQKNPPDFYYGTCPKEPNDTRIMPSFAQHLYTNIPTEGKPSCLWIKTDIVSNISDARWKKANELLFDKP